MLRQGTPVQMGTNSTRSQPANVRRDARSLSWNATCKFLATFMLKAATQVEKMRKILENNNNLCNSASYEYLSFPGHGNPVVNINDLHTHTYCRYDLLKYPDDIQTCNITFQRDPFGGTQVAPRNNVMRHGVQETPQQQQQQQQQQQKEQQLHEESRRKRKELVLKTASVVLGVSSLIFIIVYFTGAYITM
ncbi:hypothetical protein Pcinc_022782 [Petrolisthes cinctipes]|uniref:Uncharacterized protein n=1 Tax=Petrolisthes cinctipes TaxID=88211 RepID=A0AAE1FD24_PETCI|nr:hypothetical protein Pcinc_022782 [Petrolisthes cinctipes]